jgi:hypothetical protein
MRSHWALNTCMPIRTPHFRYQCRGQDRVCLLLQARVFSRQKNNILGRGRSVVIIIKMGKREGQIRIHDDEVWRQSLTSGFVSWLILTPHPMISALANRQ